MLLRLANELQVRLSPEDLIVDSVPNVDALNARIKLLYNLMKEHGPGFMQVCIDASFLAPHV